MKQFEEDEPGDERKISRAPARDIIYCKCGKRSEVPADDQDHPQTRMLTECSGHEGVTTALAPVTTTPVLTPPTPTRFGSHEVRELGPKCALMPAPEATPLVQQTPQEQRPAWELDVPGWVIAGSVMALCYCTFLACVEYVQRPASPINP